MSTFQRAWDNINEFVWAPLASYEGPFEVPYSLYSDLFLAAEEFLSPHPSSLELLEVKNDPAKAEHRFLNLQGTDFIDEAAIVKYIEGANRVISDYGNTGFEEYFHRLLRQSINRFNLRYRLDAPFAIRILLPGSFTNLYRELARINSSNSHLQGLWQDFELAFDQYVRTQNDADLRTSIAKTSNYLEGLASATHGRAGTLGKLCDRLTDWPHRDVREAVKKIYGFCCDYPGIRHGGTPGNSMRTLDARDSIAINVSMLALASYLGSTLNHGSMVGLNPIGRPAATGITPAKVPTGFMTRIWSALGFK